MNKLTENILTLHIPDKVKIITILILILIKTFKMIPMLYIPKTHLKLF